MSPRLQKIASFVGYPLFYLICLLLFAKLTFPYDRLKGAMLSRFHADQGPSGLRLEIDEVSSYWFTGIEAEGIRLQDNQAEAPPAPGEPNTPKQTAIDSLHVSPSLFSLLLGDVVISFGGEALGGSVSGEYRHGEAMRLELELEDLALTDLPMIGDMLGLPVDGRLAGTVDLSLPEGKFAAADGSIELTISDMRVGDGKAKIRNTIALPAINAGDLSFKAESTAGRLTVSEFTVKGPDLELAGSGKAALRDPVNRSTLTFDAQFKFADSYKNKDDMTRSIFGAPNSAVPGLLDMDPKMKSSKQPDGFYAWKISGVLAKPTFTPGAVPGVGSASRKQ